MTNKKHLTFLLLLLGTLLNSCSSGDDTTSNVQPVEPITGNTSWTVEVQAEITRGLVISGTTLTPNWNKSENIFVYYKNQKVGLLHPESDNATGKIKLTGNLDTPQTPYEVNEKLYFYYMHDKGFSDYTGQDGTIDKIATDYDFATAEANISNVNTSTRKLTVALASFQSKQAIVKFSFKEGDAAASTKPAKTVKCITVSSTALASDITVTPSSATDVLYVALPLSSETEVPYYITTIDGNDNPDYIGKLASKQLANGKYYNAEVRLYEAVQLWKNGPMWPKKNLGASNETLAGDFYQWAGIEGHNLTWGHYDWDHCPYCSGGSASKYNTTDNKTVLESIDDAATVQWGSACRIPTKAEFDALINNTTHEWISASNGIRFTGKNDYAGKSIFLRANGYCYGNSQDLLNICYYWASTFVPTSGKQYGGDAAGLYCKADGNDAHTSVWAARSNGFQIRAIIDWK